MPARTPRRTARGHLFTLTSLAVLLLVGLIAPGQALANRFGPPWQGRIGVDQATLLSQPDPAAAAAGSLARGEIVVVVGESQATDGTAWSQVPGGWLRSSDVVEDFTPWVAEVSVASVSIYARPNTGEPIRRTAGRGDLLRVTGVSPGIEGDSSVWWSTTEGYVGLDTLHSGTSEWAQNWTMPDGSQAANGWWGGVRSQANVRVAATTQAPIVGSLVPGDRIKVLEELTGDAVGTNATWYRIDGGRYAGAAIHSSLVTRLAVPRTVQVDRPADAPAGLGVVVVSRSASSLTYLDVTNTPVFTTYVSLGRAGVETPVGEYSTMGKYRFDNMSSTTVSNADHAYHLPNVPFVQYYLDGGYALHSTYWHDQFGLVESQGCINLSWGDGAYLFGLTQPTVAAGDVARWAIGTIQATPLLITP